MSKKRYKKKGALALRNNRGSKAVAVHLHVHVSEPVQAKTSAMESGRNTLFTAFVGVMGDLCVSAAMGFLLMLVGLLVGAVSIPESTKYLYTAATLVVTIILTFAGIGCKVYPAFVEMTQPKG